MEFRTPFNYDRDAVSRETGCSCGEPSLAIQSARDETDINTIVRRFGVTGMAPGTMREPLVGDFTAVPQDYHAAVMLSRRTAEAFAQLPAAVRAKFENDPAAVLDFIADASNREQAIELGLIEKPVASPPPPVPGAPLSAS